MEKSEILLAFELALVAIVLGFLLFRHFFDLSTLKIKPRFSGMRQRIREWIHTHGKTVVLIIAAVIVGIVLLYSGLRFAGPLVKAISTLISRPTAASEPAVQADPLP